MSAMAKRLTARHCACRTRQAQPPRTPRAAQVAERAAALGVDVETCSLRDVAGDRQLHADLSVMDLMGLHRVCGWPRFGRSLDPGRWVS